MDGIDKEEEVSYYRELKYANPLQFTNYSESSASRGGGKWLS
jgi:hypothetical protein